MSFASDWLRSHPQYSGVQVPSNNGSASSYGTRDNSGLIRTQAPNYQQPNGTLQYSPANSNNNNGGGGNGGGNPVPNNNGLQDAAAAARDNALNTIRQNLSFIRDTTQRNIDQAGGVRNDLFSNIGTTYGNLRGAATDKLASSLGTLNQEGIDTANQYSQAGGTARAATDSATRNNRITARALNRGDSSFYQDQQAQTQNAGAKSIADLQLEAASKQAGIGTRKSDTQSYFDHLGIQLGQEEAQARNQADSQYQSAVNQASDAERLYGINSADSIQSAQNQYQGALNQISSYIGNKATALSSIQNKAAATQGLFASYDPNGGGLSNTLANNNALSYAGNINSNPMSSYAPQSTGGTNYLGYTNQTPKLTAYDQLIQRLNPNQVIG